MRFFSGFGFENDYEIFSDILEKYKGNYNIAGFSYGAQNALEFSLKNNTRINRLILLSPAFFNDIDDWFIHKQLGLFAKNSKVYMKYFLKNIGFENKFINYLKTPDAKDLKLLLKYRFNSNSMYFLKSRGIKFDIYIGSNDKIINVNNACEFFARFGIVYLLKNANHLLKYN
ncbi:pimelyl-ACP methyl ester esterase BioV [Helicobacter sp. MIT 14-3879]|uniref:pimelyl-ACP methyl ester esterase BioV n=1 Tax=Helicobacter sp. MIT 14-3879 TaxID=2040649 RepID=UPI000E1F122E|nr:pimelyl-ACP methyl ester esterase BioV [Helicobacter sp. MIT 14-3879]RDU62438.1 hypothetical protein CQA44_06900 [Helicobacter sp. MIT 14-3879]